MPTSLTHAALAATLAAALALPALAQEAAPADTAPPVILLPAPAESDANLQTNPDMIQPADGSRCGHDKAVTS